MKYSNLLMHFVLNGTSTKHKHKNIPSSILVSNIEFKYFIMMHSNTVLQLSNLYVCKNQPRALSRLFFTYPQDAEKKHIILYIHEFWFLTFSYSPIRKKREKRKIMFLLNVLNFHVIHRENHDIKCPFVLLCHLICTFIPQLGKLNCI